MLTFVQEMERQYQEQILNGFASFHIEDTWVLCSNSYFSVISCFRRKLSFCSQEEDQNWNTNDTQKEEYVTFKKINSEISFHVRN